MKAAKGEDGNGESEDGDTPAAQADTDAAGLSNALCADLTAQRTAALRAVLAGNVPVALATLAHALALAVFYPGYAENPLDVRGVSPCLNGEGIDDNRGSKDMAARHAAWLQHRIRPTDRRTAQQPALFMLERTSRAP